MRWGGQARRNFPRSCPRRSYKEGPQRSCRLASQFPRGARRLLTYLLTNLHSEQGSLARAEPRPQFLLCHSRYHRGRITALSPYPRGWGPSLGWSVRGPSPGGQTTSQGHRVRACNTQPLLAFSVPGPGLGAKDSARTISLTHGLDLHVELII